MNSIWKSSKLHYVRRLYGPYVEKFRDHDDDCQIFVNIYNEITKALQTLREDPHPYIKAAVSCKLREDFEIMDRIIDTFKGRDDL